ncbi:Putative Capsular polysaccharide biosynthesis protein capD [Vibrio nigripulchritudo SFn27]|uniref:Putative Capsular polysaccharide biosynthesis protein capD n=1 Tax=Vibrio nigripulchritudo TaxID=28173 RepID=U4K2X3_9VIBR|nr:nucleoside-diphosphate sugar epimerase/dehydratase [Vibrio nigripulchritudo]CCN80330.1 Putative Capsular polysaccharide biosynthesis protein capD [Vibrio nigripulchritudo BLFn1]CCN91254.1 Putative Capsular polysaccharide biosynthesis protein capD [Vibrio nigripulchritudo SFn27]CCN92661.1 Putative Capsular polysaccharide biosynthesis protein capD [Vibrio nigripulchritudo ENn2]CCO41065.1 Putative Capsular polysaccharide biosynthesis protein capD [Vibrio nigripulchritudo SFn135]CCO50611.1 Puta
MQRLQFIWQLSRTNKRIVSVLIDIILIFMAFHLAILVRSGETNYFTYPAVWGIQIAVTVVTIAVFARLGLYRAVLRYLTFQALFVVTAGAVISATLVAALSFYMSDPFPRTVPIIYGAFLALFCGGPRVIVRSLIAQSYSTQSKEVLIYGAGSGGRQLAMALRSSGDYRVRAFIDGDSTLCNTMILGLPVIAIEDAVPLINKYDVSQVLLAVPSAKRSRRKVILDELAKLPVEVLTVPDMTDIVSGKAKIDELKDVAIEDLLGRDPVAPQQVLLEANIKDKVVMVTGAGGSIGSELCRQIVEQSPKSVILFELSEFGLYQIDRELNQLKVEKGLTCDIIPLLGSVQRQHRLETTMAAFEVQTVYHAAAYKHVPLVEFNVIEGVRNNIYGTYYTACAAIKAGVESFVLISTDKAVRPTNVMGTTKRMAELGLQALADQEKAKPNGTRFCMVRFGNVLGSSGSVIPVFKKQIASGGPVTVTHSEITRFFMTIPEAAQLVIQAGAMGKGGDVFVLDMGESVKITDLASNLIQLSGLEVKSEANPHGDIEIQFSGLRPGEKLYEELLIGDNVKQTAHERIMTAHEVYLPQEEYDLLLSELDFACHSMDHESIRTLLLSAPTGFNPTDGIGDLVWSHNQSKVDYSDSLKFVSQS